MKERGMIFNAEMVRAILEGRKTQTRRIMKPQPIIDNFVCPHDGPRGGHIWPSKNHQYALHVEKMLQNGEGGWEGLASDACHFGEIGDRIWVRETWATLGNEDGCYVDWEENLCKGDERSAARIYRASCEQRPGDYGLWSIPDNAYWKPHTKDLKFEGAWRPSIHMPRWASRILLEITDVRVERLRSMTQEDARAEGVIAASGPMEAGLAFRELWDSIYGPDSWQANPWVWVIEFKRVEGGAA
jgi:hypothetical protein